jgi:hypothetical protein
MTAAVAIASGGDNGDRLTSVGAQIMSGMKQHPSKRTLSNAAICGYHLKKQPKQRFGGKFDGFGDGSRGQRLLTDGEMPAAAVGFSSRIMKTMDMLPNSAIGSTRATELDLMRMQSSVDSGAEGEQADQLLPTNSTHATTSEKLSLSGSSCQAKKSTAKTSVF